MLTAQNRAKLRSLATNLKDLVFIGKEGLTDNVIILKLGDEAVK